MSPYYPEPPPHLQVPLAWAAAAGTLETLRTTTGAELPALCAASAAAYRAALLVEGGPAGDTTITETLLVELAAWLRALDDAAYAAVISAADDVLGLLDPRQC